MRCKFGKVKYGPRKGRCRKRRVTGAARRGGTRRRARRHCVAKAYGRGGRPVCTQYARGAAPRGFSRPYGPFASRQGPGF